MQSMNGSIQVTLQRERAHGNKRSNSTAVPFPSSLIASLYFNYFMETSVSHLGGAPGPCPDTFSVVTIWGEVPTGIWWVETRDAAKLPTVLRTVPTTRSDLARNVSSAETEKPQHGGWTGACIEELLWGKKGEGSKYFRNPQNYRNDDIIIAILLISIYP